MSRPSRSRAVPWLGSVALHLLFVVVLAVAAMGWRTDPPPEQLAVEGDVVRYEDLPDWIKAGKPMREQPVPQIQAPPEPEPVPLEPEPEPEVVQPDPVPEPGPQGEQVDIAAQQAAAEAQRLEQERIALEQRQAEERQAELRRAQEAEAQRLKAEEERKRVAEEQRKRDEALAAKRKQLEEEKAAREAKLRAEREAELKRQLALEEEGEAFARSGILDEYRALLTQTIERNWIRPPSARKGLKCMLYVTQGPGGAVIDVRVGECNGDQAVRESITNAVYKSDPLPPPRDPRAFQRQLVLNFQPKE